MSYQAALEAAGVTVHDFKAFGSYQGEWVAYVTHEGQTGFIVDYYGSCSGCDAFEAAFGWGDDKEEDYQERLADFGRGYINIVSAEAAKKNFHPEWDGEADGAIAWIDARTNQE